jgi:hypothetical protein
MKNSKILPFGDWFKVYEKAGSNFNKTQRLLESQMILEAGDVGITMPAPGADFSFQYLSGLESMKYKVGSAIVEDSNYTKAVDKIKNFGLTADRQPMPGGKVGGSGIHKDSLAKDFLETLIAARAIRLNKQTKKKKDLAKFKAWVNSCIRNFDIQRSSANDLALVPSSETYLKVNTIGYIQRMTSVQAKIEKEGTSSTSYLDRLKEYINVWNFLQYAGGENAQYDQSSIVDGYFDLQVANGEIGPANAPSVLLYGDKFYEKATAERQEQTEYENVGGVDAAKGQADIEFPTGKSDILESQIPKIKALAEIVKAKFGKDQTVDNFELISSASPVWSGGETMADYEGKETTGTGDPGVGTDFATKNYKLAYDRGVSFMRKLNEILQEMGHPGFNNPVIKWQVSDQGPAGGKYVDLQIERNYQKPKKKVTTTVTGKQTSAGGSQGDAAKLYAYKFVIGRGAESSSEGED